MNSAAISRLISASIFALSAVTGMVCYGWVQSLEQRYSPLLDSLPGRSMSYDIFLRKSCVGNVELVIFDQAAVSLQLRGEVMLAGESAALDGDFHFNPLGQLTASQLTVKSSGAPFVLTSTGTNPLTLTVRDDGLQPIKNVIPGPVLIEQTPHNTFAIKYVPLTVDSRPERPWLEALARELELVFRARSDSRPCTPQNSEAIDGVLRRVTARFASLPNLN